MENENDVKEFIFFGEDYKSDVDEKNLGLIEVLKKLAPGTSIRTALDDIMRARMGALIVVDKEGVLNLVEGGFRVNCKFSSQKLVELAKMDGAIVLSDDLKKIFYANALLAPNVNIKSKETGTRHQAAERTSKQTGAIVIAVSERKNKITLYYGDLRYVLEQSSEVLRRATETLQILEKQKEIFKDLMINLNILEINNLTTTNDVCGVLQRIEMIKRISDIVRRCLVELGKEGIIVSMRLKELVKGLNNDKDMILRDYFGSKALKIESILRNMNFDFLLEVSNISRVLFEELHEKSISPRGVRILSKTNLLEKDVKLLINHFGTLDKVFDADRDDLTKVLKNEDLVDSLRADLESLREKILVGKKV